MRLLALFGPFKDRNDGFPTLSNTSTNEIPTLSSEACERYPFRAEHPRVGHYREYPPGVSATRIKLMRVENVTVKKTFAGTDQTT